MGMQHGMGGPGPGPGGLAQNLHVQGGVMEQQHMKGHAGPPGTNGMGMMPLGPDGMPIGMNMGMMGMGMAGYQEGYGMPGMGMNMGMMGIAPGMGPGQEHTQAFSCR